MIIDLRDVNGNLHRCESINPTTIATWFKEWIPLILASTERGLMWQITIHESVKNEFPETKLPQINNGTPTLLNREGYLEMAKLFFALASETSMIHATEKRNYL